MVRVRRRTKGASPRARGGLFARKQSAFRQEVVQLHREIFRRNQRRINESVSGYSPAFRAYEQQYARRVQRYQRRATIEELEAQIAASDVLYVGDYHTLPQSQRSFVRLLRRIPLDRQVVVALEFVQGRYQNHIDAYVSGRISEETFLRKIHHDTHWVFGGWQSFRQIFELAQQRSWRVIGIDAPGRGPAGASLRSRDQYAAKRITAELLARPESMVAVLVGELHVAPSHLPHAVEHQLAARKQSQRRVIIYQNCHEIYWELERRNLEHDTELVRVSPDEFCLMNTPPIVCQQSFLNWLDYDDDIAHSETPEEVFKEYATLIASFFDLPLRNEVDEIEITTVVDLSFLSRLRKRGDFSRSDLEKVKSQILRSDSYYIPRAKMVYLGNISVNHASEEATHFLRHVCCPQLSEPKLLIDAFYARCIEEAIGFLGSKLINHKRKCASESYFQRVLRSRNIPAFERRLARLTLRHIEMESGKRVRNMSEVYECDAHMFNAITHVLGYRLGNRLYYGLVRGVLSKKQVRELFFDPLEEEGSALAAYLGLLFQTKNVHVPSFL